MSLQSDDSSHVIEWEEDRVRDTVDPVDEWGFADDLTPGESLALATIYYKPVDHKAAVKMLL